jgi:hypothetical protein
LSVYTIPVRVDHAIPPYPVGKVMEDDDALELAASLFGEGRLVLVAPNTMYVFTPFLQTLMSCSVFCAMELSPTLFCSLHLTFFTR